MILYKTLRQLPMVVAVEIIETGNVSLLSDNDDNDDIDNHTPTEILHNLWADLHEQIREFSEDKSGYNKTFNIVREIEFLSRKYDVIQLAAEGLLFEASPELLDMLSNYGYIIRSEHYLDDLKKLQRESQGIFHKIKQFEGQLPQKSEEKTLHTVVDNMAVFASILGFDFDFYSCSVEKYYALEKSVKSKVKNIEQQNKKSNGKK